MTWLCFSGKSNSWSEFTVRISLNLSDCTGNYQLSDPKETDVLLDFDYIEFMVIGCYESIIVNSSETKRQRIGKGHLI